MIPTPWMLAMALQADGWYLRSDIIWAKPNAMPESVTDRPSKSHEYLFLLTKSPRYFFDGEAVRRPFQPASVDRGNYGHNSFGKGQFVGSPSDERHQNGKKVDKVAEVMHPDGANIRSVWTIPVGRYKHAHFATFPKKLVIPCIRAGTSEKGCCPTCLTPWRRVVKKERKATRPGTESKIRIPAGWDTSTGEGGHGTFHKEGREKVGNRDPYRHVTSKETVGWKPACECPKAEPVPCTVGDMFAGSGTTLAVAVDLGRKATGCELNPKYVNLIERRMRFVVPSFC